MGRVTAGTNGNGKAAMRERNREPFTKTEQAMMDLLSDGLPHTYDELHACCGPSGYRVISFHICRMRKKLLNGQDIIYTLHKRRASYQLVRLIGSANKG